MKNAWVKAAGVRKEEAEKCVLTDVMRFSFSSPAFPAQLKLTDHRGLRWAVSKLHHGDSARHSITAHGSREKCYFFAENWRNFKVEAVAPSWRPCLGATEAPPVSSSRRSRSHSTFPTGEERELFTVFGLLVALQFYSGIPSQRQLTVGIDVYVCVQLQYFVCVV